MRRRRSAGFGVLWWGPFLAGMLAGPAAAQVGPTYRVEPLTFDARLPDSVGPKRMGTFCLPAGSIAWREARPEAGDARDAFAAGLRAGGLEVADTGNPFGEGVRGAERAIRAGIRGVHLSACVPPGGWARLVPHSHGVKGDGTIAITWRAYARGQDAPVAHGPTCVTFRYDEPRASVATMMLAGLVAAGRQVAADVVAGGASQASEAATCKRLSEQPGSTFVVTSGDE